MADSIRTEFGKYIRDFRTRQKEAQGHIFSQSQLCRCLTNHAKMRSVEKWATQKTISRLERGEPVILPEELVYILQDYCGIPKDVVGNYVELMKKTGSVQENNTASVTICEDGQLLANASHEEFLGYLGSYYCYFHSTNSEDPRLIEGEFSIEKDKSRSADCTAELNIIENGEVIKKYRGQFLINNHFRTSYCILIGDDKQEVCMLIGNHFNITKGMNQLTMALALTTSAGSQKRPTMHRILFCRKELTKAQKASIHALLKLNTDRITVSESKINQLEQVIKKKLNNMHRKKECEKLEAILECISYIRQHASREVYYTIDESIIYDSSLFSENAKVRSQIVSTLRECTNTDFYNKVSNTVEEICMSLIETPKK